jgi:hypothetical protein
MMTGILFKPCAMYVVSPNGGAWALLALDHLLSFDPMAMLLLFPMEVILTNCSKRYWRILQISRTDYLDIELLLQIELGFNCM